MEETNIFNIIETTEKPSAEAKKAVFSEIEIIQNASQVMEHFLSNYFKTIIGSFSSSKKIE